MADFSRESRSLDDESGNVPANLEELTGREHAIWESPR